MVLATFKNERVLNYFKNKEQSYSIIRTYMKASRPCNRVVVTGLGIVSPLGIGAKLSWNNILQGKSGASRISDEGFKDISSKVACYVPEDQELLDTLNKEKNRMSRSMVFGLRAAKEALQDANWFPDSLSLRSRTGVSVRMGMVDLDYIGSCYQELKSGKQRKISPYFVPKILPNLAAGYISSWVDGTKFELFHSLCHWCPCYC